MYSYDYLVVEFVHNIGESSIMCISGRYNPNKNENIFSKQIFLPVLFLSVNPSEHYWCCKIIFKNWKFISNLFYLRNNKSRMVQFFSHSPGFFNFQTDHKFQLWNFLRLSFFLFIIKELWVGLKTTMVAQVLGNRRLDGFDHHFQASVHFPFTSAVD